MKVVSLPEFSASKKDDKGQPAVNTVAITNSKAEGIEPTAYDNGVTVTIPENKKGLTFNLPAKLIQFNQYESLPEFVADCGGEDKALVIVNDFKREASADAAKMEIRTTTNKDVNAVVKSALSAAINHTFQEAAKLDAKEFAKFGKNLSENIDAMSDAEIAAALREQLKLAMSR